MSCALDLSSFRLHIDVSEHANLPLPNATTDIPVHEAQGRRSRSTPSGFHLHTAEATFSQTGPNQLCRKSQDILTLHTPRLIFVCLTNILLITSLISLVSNSLTEVGPYFEILAPRPHICDQRNSAELMHTPLTFPPLEQLADTACKGHGTCTRRVSLPVRSLVYSEDRWGAR